MEVGVTYVSTFKSAILLHINMWCDKNQSGQNVLRHGTHLIHAKEYYIFFTIIIFLTNMGFCIVFFGNGILYC